MNKHLSRAVLASLAMDSADMLERVQRPAMRHNAPFSKTSKGKARRDQRRAAIKAKRAFFA